MKDAARKALAATRLLLRFLQAVVVSGLQTARVIARGRDRPAAGFVRLRFEPMTETGAALLGSLITLTPGTTTVDIDLERREMLLHLLDVESADAAVAGIRRDFERDVVTLFGTGARR